MLKVKPTNEDNDDCSFIPLDEFEKKGWKVIDANTNNLMGPESPSFLSVKFKKLNKVQYFNVYGTLEELENKFEFKWDPGVS